MFSGRQICQGDLAMMLLEHWESTCSWTQRLYCISTAAATKIICPGHLQYKKSDYTNTLAYNI